MKRPMLISSITVAVVCAFLMLFSHYAAIVTVLLAVSVIIIYSIKPFKLRKYIAVPTACIFALITVLAFTVYNSAKIEPCMDYDGQTGYIAGKIITVPSTKNGYTVFTVKTQNITNDKTFIKAEVKIPESAARNIALYDYISVNNAQFSVIKNERNRLDVSEAADGVILQVTSSDAEFLWHCERTPYYYCLAFKQAVMQKINDFMQADTGGLLNGMLFGETSGISTDILNAFRSSGIAHLLAVSGLHTSLWCGLLISIFKLFKIPEKAANVICIVFLAAFCTVSAFTPSVIRASLMMVVLLIAPFFKRKSDALNSLGVAVTVLLLSNPYIITSISFQLSATSTLGVLLASSSEQKIYKLTSKLKSKLLKSVCDYLLTSFLISFAASLFTLPISAYHFGVFGIISPLTNIFCVKLAFYGMLSGSGATLLAFFNNSHIKNIAVFIFRISNFILTTVIDISKKFADFKYCTLPVQKNFLIITLIAGVLIFTLAYILKKAMHKDNTLKIAAALTVAVLFVNIAIPVLPTKYANTLTVLSDGDNLNIVIRSGTHYMYIQNSQTAFSTQVYNYLPKATCETLDCYVATYLSYNSVSDLKRLSNAASPQETHIAPSLKYIAAAKNVQLPDGTVIPAAGKYTLNGEITVEIVDTTPMLYAIIKGRDKTVYVHMHGSADFQSVLDTEPGDIFIYNSKLPPSVPASAEKVIVNSDTDILTDKNMHNIRNTNCELFLTAEYGDVQIMI